MLAVRREIILDPEEKPNELASMQSGSFITTKKSFFANNESVFKKKMYMFYDRALITPLPVFGVIYGGLFNWRLNQLQSFQNGNNQT